MELLPWLSLASVCVLGAMTPGASLAVVLKHTLSGSRKHGVYASIAHGAGIALYAILTVLGLALVIQQTPWLYDLLKYAGAGFLLWLAYKAFTAQSSLQSDSTLAEQPKMSLGKSIYQGFMIAFLNPKIAIFFIALFSQFIDSHTLWQQKLIMVITVAGIDTLWYCLIALLVSHASVMDRLKAKAHIIDKVSGVALMLVATKVIFT